VVTNLARVFRFVKANPGCLRLDAQVALGLTFQQAHRSMVTLQTRGLVVRSGNTRRARWSVAPGAVEPRDGRGQAQATRDALYEACQRPAVRLKVMRNLQHVRFDRFGNFHRKPKPGTELERAFGWGV
jgi:DNA-binding IclR family transcriptional regulator